MQTLARKKQYLQLSQYLQGPASWDQARESDHRKEYVTENIPVERFALWRS
jgi:hypothetical protein